MNALTPAQAKHLAQYLRSEKIVCKGAVGPVPGVRHFTRLCSNSPGQLRMGQRILQLTSVTNPRPVSGAGRAASAADVPVLCRFNEAFYREILPYELPQPDELERSVRLRIERGEAFLWIDGGEPVASTQVSRPTRNGITINGVFTPKERRGRGYASNLVAEVSRRMLEAGRSFCVLYTDAANPTSNGIYESLGYREIGVSEYWSF